MYSWPLTALIHWEVKVGGTGMKDVGGAVLAGSSPPFRERERAAVDVDVGPERRSPRYHETCLALDSFIEICAAVISKPRCVWLSKCVVVQVTPVSDSGKSNRQRKKAGRVCP